MDRHGNLGNFLDDRGVSSVIGVILMVAVVVILAAVIGTFVLGLGDTVSESPPKATFSVIYSDNHVGTNNKDDSITITHEGGETIENGAITVKVTDFSLEGGSTITEEHTLNSSVSWSDSPIKSGVSVTIDNEPDLDDSDGNVVKNGNCGGCTGLDLDLNGATIRVVWRSSADGSTQILYEWTGPDA